MKLVLVLLLLREQIRETETGIAFSSEPLK